MPEPLTQHLWEALSDVVESAEAVKAFIVALSPPPETVLVVPGLDKAKQTSLLTLTQRERGRDSDYEVQYVYGGPSATFPDLRPISF